MTRCFVYIKNTSKMQVQVVGTRGSDWGETVNAQQGPNESNFIVVQSMGCPRAGTETNHWGWLYLKAWPTDFPQFTKYFAVYFKLRHSGDCMEMGFFAAPMTKDSDQPDFRGDINMPSDGRNVAHKDCENAGEMTWYPDNQDEDWKLRDGEKGAPVICVTCKF